MTDPSAGSLFAAIKAAGRPQGPRCSVAVIRDDLPPDDARDLIAAMADPTVHATTIAAVLKERGYQIRGDTIRRHIKHECNC